MQDKPLISYSEAKEAVQLNCDPSFIKLDDEIFEKITKNKESLELLIKQSFENVQNQIMVDLAEMAMNNCK